ncbi:hypothetical protein [Pseudoalteromonas sp. ASV78]|uniref:hypothetical protein n=1 Tax=Pseudoalteromonas sp. ASV78 TaxID=3397851 RepID=UPI0039FDC5E8
MSFEYTPESALTLSMNGTSGTFKAGHGNETIEVKYLLTHVSLDPNSSQDKSLLRELAPFREIFDFKDLEFDELMQRDIDDARVSHELIPYILDEKNQAAVKFFPPIVVLLLPTETNQVKPAAYYEKVETIEEPFKTIKGVERWSCIRSGSPGNEVFQFDQPILFGDKPDSHNFVTLRVNPNKSKLVIVDGQHRAMALLALYRNTQKGWDGETKEAFKQYYEEWTPDFINTFDLSGIKLPIILCTLPDLDSDYVGDFNLKKAARSIFLTLNQNARPVSNVRNLLLDDNDIISSFLRGILAQVKNRDLTEDNSFRIFNVELDQVDNKVKLQSTTAFTGVQHLYYIIEHLLLNSDDVNGVSPRSGRFKSRKSDGYINGLKRRLNTSDVLGTDVDSTISRSSFSNKVESILSKQFETIYGKSVLTIFEKLFPFSIHCDSVLTLKSEIEETADKTIKSIFFDGQGVAKVFEKHRSSLNEKYKDRASPELKELLDQIDGKAKAIEKLQLKFKENRFNRFISALTDKSKLNDENGNINTDLKELVNGIFDNSLTTVAFQSALICGFFHIFEQVSTSFDGNADVSLCEELDNYLDNLNVFFKPKSFSQFKKFVSVFSGKLTGDNGSNIQYIERSADSFRNVVCRSEMQPDLWPKYRYLLLELWKPKSTEMQKVIDRELDECRNQVFIELYEDGLKQFCKAKLIHESDLGKEGREQIFDESFASYKGFLKNLTNSVAALDINYYRKLI